MKPADVRGLYEEIANSVSHAIGLGMAVAGWSALLVQSVDTSDTWRITAAIVFGTCLLSMYLSSVLYHGYQVQPLKHFFRVCDHITIYFVICGTITPFLLVYGQSTYDWAVLGIIWLMALCGSAYKIFFFGRSEVESVATYMAMSVVALLGVIPILQQLEGPCLSWLLGGLILYTIGVWFYLHDHRPFHHTAWHFCVLGGSICHFIAVWVYVIGDPV